MRKGNLIFPFSKTIKVFFNVIYYTLEYSLISIDVKKHSCTSEALSEKKHCQRSSAWVTKSNTIYL